MLLMSMILLLSSIIVNSYPLDTIDDLDNSALSQDAYIAGTDSSDSSNTECPLSAFTTDGAEVEKGSVFRRATSCSANTPSKEKPILKPKPPLATELIPLPRRPAFQTKETRLDPCLRPDIFNPDRQDYVTCGGPEVWTELEDSNDSRFVANCVRGWASVIKKSERFEETRVVARYCCKKYRDTRPFYTSIRCTRITQNSGVERMNKEAWDTDSRFTLPQRSSQNPY